MVWRQDVDDEAASGEAVPGSVQLLDLEPEITHGAGAAGDGVRAQVEVRQHVEVVGRTRRGDTDDRRMERDHLPPDQTPIARIEKVCEVEQDRPDVRGAVGARNEDDPRVSDRKLGRPGLLGHLDLP